MELFTGITYHGYMVSLRFPSIGNFPSVDGKSYDEHPPQQYLHAPGRTVASGSK